ncbi:MAG: transcriptional repressor [Natronospirillum sp.]|uniref:Fur family transcriptional regulator n=1 Tax=Natronospirillum sp. TaxID=2812955 RepID=UPI0025D794EF|nr:Fur family transcriptional regulator [Natronospirillum sp.]MCH8552108.1 transcriptional repressor [Natronospirillum sp.]
MADLAQASAWCAQRGEKFTPTRRAVFEILAEQDQALTAYQLLERLQQAMPHAKPPTIYRALEFLQRMGLIHRIDSRNAFVVCDDFPHHHDSAFLVCQECGGVTEVTMDHVVEKIAADAAAQDFSVKHATVEIRGVCKQCQN